jgi:importin-4
MNLINDPDTQRAACNALDSVLEILHDNIEQYLQLIMDRLSNLLENAPLTVKAVVTGAIGSAAHASKQGFLPYFLSTINRVAQFLTLTDDGEESDLRGVAMDTISTFAEAVGKDVFRPYFPEMMKHAFSGMEMGNTRLRECSFSFFGAMASVFGEEFAPYLTQVMPALLTSCNQPERGEDEYEGALFFFPVYVLPDESICSDDCRPYFCK